MKLFLTLLISVTLLSCSRLDIALNYAPRYMANQLDENFDLSSERYEKLKSRMEADIRQNKKQIVNAVVQTLDEVKALAEKKSAVSPDEIRSLNLKVRDLQRQGVYLFKPSFAELILPLKPPEIKSLTENSQERFEKSQKRLQNPDEYIERTMKSFNRVMGFMFDSASAEQKKVYRNFVTNNMDYFRLHLEHRKSHINQFNSLQSEKENLLQYSLAFYAGEESAKSETFRARQQKYFADLIDLQIEIWKICSAEQITEFIKNINNLKADLQKWSEAQS